MDDKRFDALTRSLAGGTSRRRVLKGLLGGLVGGAAVATRLNQAGAGPIGGTCTDDTECEVPPGLDSCTGAVCEGSVCALNPCAAGQQCCDIEGGTCAECCADTDCTTGVCLNATIRGFCAECATVFDCVLAEDSCLIVSCTDNQCLTTSLVCQDCESCNTGTCVSNCPDCQDCVSGVCTTTEFACGQACCDSASEACCEDDGCCAGVCYGGTSGRDYCCQTDQGGLYCDTTGSPTPGECCADPVNEKCCGTSGCCAGQCFGTDDNSCCEASTSFVCEATDECCLNAENCCSEDGCCAGSCNSAGSCCPSNRAFACGSGCCDNATEKCCVGVCIPAGNCCGDDECGDCENCYTGQCISDCSDSDECCRGACVDLGTCCGEAGDECGLIVNGTFPAAGNSQLDCCNGLVCCENDFSNSSSVPMYCAECCNDWGCGKGYHCCHGECIPEDRCCDDQDCGDCEVCGQGACVPIGARFGEQCGVVRITEGGSPQLDCCDGLVCCEIRAGDSDDSDDDDDDWDGAYCAECCGDWDCPKGAECRHGVCTFECQSDKDCADGTCCCKSGHCSKHCCAAYTPEYPDKPGDKPDVSYGGPVVNTLPSTGIGDDQSNAGWLGAAALGAAAAYIASKKLKDDAPEAQPTEE